MDVSSVICVLRVRLCFDTFHRGLPCRLTEVDRLATLLFLHGETSEEAFLSLVRRRAIVEPLLVAGYDSRR